MKALVFDTETTGTPKNYKAKMTDLENWPRCTQIAWLLVDVDTAEVINEYQSLIKPDGWHIPTPDELAGSKNPNFFVENNMSTERCEAEGKPIIEVLDLLISDMNTADYIVAHNLNFDKPIVGAEMLRIGIKASKKLKPICTMESTTDYCKLPGPYGFKWPKLIELHNHLFGCDFSGCHDALDDVRATTNCFLELIKRKVIIL